MRNFKSPKRSFGSLDGEAASTLVAAASDVAVVVDDDGAIRDLAFNNEDLVSGLGDTGAWIGRPFIETVTIESQSKVEALIAEAGSRTVASWRQVNHPVPEQADVPVLYSAVSMRSGRLVMVGRDLRPLARLQQRLVDAQQTMERDYAKLREAETRYRLLFEVSNEPVLLVDSVALTITDANPAAARLLETRGKRLLGSPFIGLFSETARSALGDFVQALRAKGVGDFGAIRLGEDGRQVTLSAALLRQARTTAIMVRLGAPSPEPTTAGARADEARLLKLLEGIPDGVVVADDEGRVQSANRAFMEMAQLVGEDQARGQRLDRWLGRAGLDLNLVFDNVRRHGEMRMFETQLKPSFGAPINVEISAVAMVVAKARCFGVTIRNVDRRLGANGAGVRELPRSVEQLKDLIGRMSLKELVRESTDMIERFYIEAALELTGDNRASAAEMLGLSRQSLYVKLRRYGIADLPIGGEA